jgi:hypothetical protein
MSTYPTGPRAPFLEWCDVQTPVFVASAASIGLTASQAAGFAAATAEAHAAILAQGIAQEVARAATQRARAAVRDLRQRAGDAVRSVRAYAETTPAPLAVYNTAQIPPPAAHTPAPPPAQPKRLSAELDASRGALTIRWKARHPSGATGTTYLVRRRLPGEAAFTFVGVTGKKRFIDDTLPAGVAQAQYTVQAQRADRGGRVSEILQVRMGSAVSTATRPARGDGVNEAVAFVGTPGGAAQHMVPNPPRRGRTSPARAMHA